MKKFGISILFSILILIFSVQNSRAAPTITGGGGTFDTSSNYTYTGKFDAGGGEFQIPNGTQAEMDALTGVADGDLFLVNDGDGAGDCSTGGQSTLVLCVYDAGQTDWVTAGDGTGGQGSGSVTTIQLGDTDVDSNASVPDIVTIDFDAVTFTAAENPGTEANIGLDLTPSSGNPTLVATEDALQVKYNTTDFKEDTDGLYLSDSPTIVTGLLIGSDPADAGTIRLPNAGSLAWEDATEASITHVDNTGWLINSTHQLQFGDSGTYVAQLNDGYLDLVSDTATRINGAATTTLGATDIFLIEGDTTRTGTNPVLDIDATFDTTTASNDVTVLDMVFSRAATDTGSTIGINLEMESNQTGVSTTLNEGIVVTADNDWSPSGDTRLRGVRLNFQPDSFTETSPVGVGGFVMDYDSTNLSANSGTVHAFRSDIDHTNATYSVDGIYSFDTSLDIGASSTTDGNVYTVNNNTDISGTVTGNMAGWYNDYGDDLDGVMNGYVVGTATIIGSGSTGTFGDAGADIVTGNLVVFDLTNATVGGTASGEYMSLTGPIPKGQFMDYHPDTVTATDDVMAIDLDVDRAAADTGGIVGINVHITTGDMANAETSYGIKLDFDQSASTTATSNLYGLSLENITGDAQVTEHGINIGTGWDKGINFAEAEADIVHSGATSLSIISTSGTVIVEGLTVNDTVITGATSITSTALVGALTGNADSATLATTVTVSDDENTADAHEVVFTTNNANLESDGTFNYNPSTGMVTATGFTGALTGNADTVTTNANLTGEVTSVGNAATIADSIAVTSWNLTTPTITSGATFTPADASPDADGELVMDSTVTGLDDGAFAYYEGGDTVYYLAAFPVLPVTDNHVLSYDSATDRLVWQADQDSAGAPTLDNVVSPEGTWSPTMQDTEIITMTFEETDADPFIILADGTFGDISIVNIHQTANATNGTMLEIGTDDADVDHLMLGFDSVAGGAPEDYVTHKIVTDGTYTIDVTSDATASVAFVDPVSITSAVTNITTLGLAHTAPTIILEDSDAAPGTGALTFASSQAQDVIGSIRVDVGGVAATYVEIDGVSETVDFIKEAHFTINAAAATFGAVGTDADVVVAFDAVTAQGSITYMEDEDRFDFDNDVDVIGDLTAATITSDAGVSGTAITGSAEANFTNNAAAVTFGSVGTDADVVLAFDAVTAQGSITYMEDEDRFDFDNDIDVIGDLTAATVTSDGVVTATTNVVIADAGNVGSASDTDAIAIAADGKTTFSQDMNLSEDLLIGDLKYIGSASDPDSMQIEADGDVVLTQDITVGGGDIKTGAIALVVGDGSTTTITFNTDGTGDAEIVLENDSVGPAELDSTTGAYDFGGVTSLEIPNGASPTTDATGEIALNTDGTDADYTGPVVQISTNGATVGYIFTMTDMPEAGEDNYIAKYDAATDLFVWEPDVGGATAWDDLGAPDANETLDMTGYYTEWDFGDVDHDMFTFFATEAFGDYSVVRIEQKTGDPTDGDLLSLATADAEDNVDQLVLANGTDDWAAFRIVEAGTLTLDITSDATASLTINDPVSFNDQALTNVGDIAIDSLSADDTNISIVASGGTVTVESVLFTAGALTGVTDITSGSATVDSGPITMIEGAQTGDPQVILDLTADASGDFSATTDTGDILLVSAADITLQVQDEDIVFSDGGADLINVASSTGVATVDFQTVNLATDALDLSEGDISNIGTVKADILEPDAVANGNLVIRGGQTATNTLKLQGYDTDTGPAYVDAITITSGTSVTVAIDAAGWDISGTGTAIGIELDADNSTITNIGDEEMKAGVNANKIGNADVDNTELSYLNGLVANLTTSLTTGTVTISTLLDVNEEIDIDFNAADEEIFINNSAELDDDLAQVTISNDDADLTDGDLAANMYLLRLEYADDGDADGAFIVCEDNGDDEQFVVDAGGTVTAAGVITSTGFTIGSAAILEAELEILDGATLTTTQLEYLNAATGTTGTTNTNVVFSASPTLTGTAVVAGIDGSGTISANLFTPDAADGADIGSTSLEFSDIYLANGSIIYGQNDQSNSITSSANGWDFALGVGIADDKVVSFGGNLTGYDWSIGNDTGDTDSLDIQVNNAANRTIKITNEGVGNANLTIDGTITATGGLSTGESATPAVDFNDSDSVASPADDNAKIYGNLTDTGDGSEDMDLFAQVQIAGILTTVIGIDADDDMEFGTASMPVKFLDDLTLHSSDEDPAAVAGNIKHDSTITNMTGGGLRWQDGGGAGLGVRLLVDLDTDPSNDDYVVSYDAALDKFYMKADADTGGAPRWDQITAPTANDEIDFGAYTIELNVTDFQVGDGTAANAVIFTGVANGQIKIGSAGVSLTGDGDGALTIAGLGDGTDEDITFNLDDTANTTVISSSTGVNTYQFLADDISILMSSVDDQDTDWWLIVDADQDAASDDPLEIGNNATVGTSPILTLSQAGDGTLTGDWTQTDTDPFILLDEGDAEDQDWWIVNNADQGASADDDLTFGIGGTPLAANTTRLLLEGTAATGTMILYADDAAYADFTVADGGALTVDVTSDGTAGVTFSDPVTLSSTLTDGTATLNSGAWSGISTLAMTGALSGATTIEQTHTAPTLTMIDTTAAAGATNVLFASSGAYDVAATFQVDEGGTPVTYFTLDGANDQILFAEKIDLTSTGIENVGNISDDAAFTIQATGGGIGILANAEDQDITLTVDDGTTDWAVTLDGSEGTVIVGSGAAFDHILKIDASANDFTLTWDEDVSELELNSEGDETLVIDLDHATDQYIGIDGSASGATHLDFAAMNMVTTGIIAGGIFSTVLTTTEGTDDTSSAAAFLTDSGESWGTNAYVGMTLYNTTDGSNCVVTANNGTTMTCTLSGGTNDDWDSGDVWEVAPGPRQSGGIFYIGSATTIRHPATAGYAAVYYSTGANVIKVDPQSGSMQFTLDGTPTGTNGEELDSAGAAGDFIAIHNQSATVGITLGRTGTWVDGGAS